MIAVKNIAGNVLELALVGTIRADDIKALAQEADALIKKHGSLRVLIDATDFEGWENLEAAEQHFGFVKNHHQKVERLAVIAGHKWQHWLAAFADFFVHPEVKLFCKDDREEAENWLRK